MGKPNSGKSFSKAGIARTDRPCYWVSPRGWKRIGPPWDYCCCCWRYYILIYNYCCNPQCPPTSPTAVGITFFHFYCSSPSQGLPARMLFYNNKILPLADCSPNVTFSIVSAPVGQKTYIFPMNFNNFYLGQISSILHRSDRCMKPMVWRTRWFVAVKNAIYYQRFSNEFQQFLVKPDFFSLTPLRSHYVSYGLAHTPICGCQKY